MNPAFLILDGASNALALSLRLEARHGFKLVRFNGEDFVGVLDRLVFSHQASRLCLSLGHLTALDRGLITPAYAREFEVAAALGGARLALVVQGAPQGLLDAYRASLLEKKLLDDGPRAVETVLDWLGIPVGEGARHAG